MGEVWVETRRMRVRRGRRAKEGKVGDGFILVSR
jgi:hypothetical protein